MPDAVARTHGVLRRAWPARLPCHRADPAVRTTRHDAGFATQRGDGPESVSTHSFCTHTL